jgi:hypothetical protein
MKMNQKYLARVIAIVMSIGITGATVQAFQDQSPDYSKNKTYQQGMREGQSDRTHNLDHSKKRHFKKDDDQKAYEAGYQKGHTN